jgi:hypothetical protein
MEANIETQKEEAEMKEKILTYHIKERTKDLNQLEAQFGQEEKGLEEEIITLKIHLQEAIRIEEVMKSQIMKIVLNLLPTHLGFLFIRFFLVY